jgi:CheY-like chemotaxis protein
MDTDGKLLLIVDDFEGVQHPYRYLLGQEGSRVEFATDGQDAVDEALALQPDVIFMVVRGRCYIWWRMRRVNANAAHDDHP